MYSELSILKEEIDQTKKSLAELQNQKKKALAEYGMTRRDLSNFIKIRESFEEAGINFENKEEAHNVLCNIRETNYDSQKLIEEVKKIRVLSLTKWELEEKCKNLEKNIEIYHKREEELKRDWKFLFYPIQVMNSLLLRGVHATAICDIFDVLSKHQHHLSIKDLAKDIDTYGSIVGAIYKKKRELENLTIYMQTFDWSRYSVS